MPISVAAEKVGVLRPVIDRLVKKGDVQAYPPDDLAMDWQRKRGRPPGKLVSLAEVVDAHNGGATSGGSRTHQEDPKARVDSLRLSLVTQLAPEAQGEALPPTDDIERLRRAVISRMEQAHGPITKWDVQFLSTAIKLFRNRP